MFNGASVSSRPLSNLLRMRSQVSAGADIGGIRVERAARIGQHQRAPHPGGYQRRIPDQPVPRLLLLDRCPPPHPPHVRLRALDPRRMQPELPRPACFAVSARVRTDMSLSQALPHCTAASDEGMSVALRCHGSSCWAIVASSPRTRTFAWASLISTDDETRLRTTTVASAQLGLRKQRTAGRQLMPGSLVFFI